jgi:hypothetical protein
MADTRTEAQLEDYVLDAAYQRTNAEFHALAARVAKRHQNAVWHLYQKVLADRGLMAMQCRRLRYLENQIALKGRTIQSLRDVADAWEDVARRHGADVSDAPVRGN